MDLSGRYVNGSEVSVFNERGDFHALAQAGADARPGLVVVPKGYWVKGSRNGYTVNAINPPAFADYGNAPTFSDTLVEVAAA